MLKISSRENQRIRRACKVRDSSIEDQIFVEGLRLAEEVLRSHLKISEVYFTETFSQTARGREFLQTIDTFFRAEVSEKISI